MARKYQPQQVAAIEDPLAGLPDDGFTRPNVAFQMIGIAESTGWLWVQQRHLPEVWRLGPNVSAFSNRALKRWAAERMVGRGK